MKPVRKQFTSDHRFPFDLVYKDTKSSQSELPDHLHDWHELVYVYRGKGTFFIDQAFYDMEEGDLFVVPGNTIHRAFPDLENPVTSTAVFFSPSLVPQSLLGDDFSYLQCFQYAKKKKAYKIPLPASEHPLFEVCLEIMQHEKLHEEAGFRHAILLQLERILLLLNRCISPENRREAMQSTVGPAWMKAILLYIDGYLENDLSLNALANQSSVTCAHFSRAFKQMTGMTVTEYVNTKRIIRAAELLLSTDYSIAAIATRIGMESIPHFHRMFKKIMGITPATYKRNQRTFTTSSFPAT